MKKIIMLIIPIITLYACQLPENETEPPESSHTYKNKMVIPIEFEIPVEDLHKILFWIDAEVDQSNINITDLVCPDRVGDIYDLNNDLVSTSISPGNLKETNGDTENSRRIEFTHEDSGLYKVEITVLDTENSNPNLNGAFSADEEWEFQLNNFSADSTVTIHVESYKALAGFVLDLVDPDPILVDWTPDS